MSGSLYSYPNNFRANKVLIAANYSGNDVAVAKFIAGVTDKTADFTAKFPLFNGVAFESKDGLVLHDANSIAYFVGNDVTRSLETEVLNWVGLSDNLLEPAACTWVYPTLGIMQYNKQNTEKAKSEIKKILTFMDSYLSTKTYLVGERISQADISVVCVLKMLYEHVMEPSFRDGFKNVNRWFVTLINQPNFKTVLGEVKLCTKMAQFDSKKYNEIYGKAKKEAAPKKNQPKKATSKGDGDKKAAAPAPAPAPKKTDPWADCPPATMDMDAWKRCFSNEKDSSKMLEYFHENFPKENYSVWRGRYQYNEELTLDFLANNLIKGMFQRLDKLRKHAFGCVCLLKTSCGKFEIDGLWIWRGHKLAFELSDDWKIDYETYTWDKLSYDDQATKDLINKFLVGEGQIDGKEIEKHNIYK